jgi:phospholipid/cholesterol/gamma-HCH transport system permease protein
MGSMLVNRERFRTYISLVLDECVYIGVNSLTIVIIVSVFMGAVTAIQTAFNLISPLIPNYIISTIVRDMTLLELAPTVTAIVFAGKVGSNIASELGNMRISEQIDAIDVMGVNASSYLVLPKIIATMVMYPLLVILAMALAILGGYAVSTFTSIMTEQEYIYGLRYEYNEYNITFALIKSLVFAFLISSISAYKGYYTRGGSLEVGQASTSAVTNSCIAVLLSDYMLAELLLK